MLTATITPFQWEFCLVVALGLVAGVLGGMLGIGGSIIMIPGLTMIFGPSQHLYQATAMIANVAVSLPAALRHRKAGAIVWPALKWMLPAAVAFVLVGVWLSNAAAFSETAGELLLRRVFAAFLVCEIGINIHRLIKPRQKPTLPPGVKLDMTHVTAARSFSAGTLMGLIAGLMGVGGGALAVPLQHMLLKLPLKCCIANSAAIMCLSASVGAAAKNATLGQHEAPLAGAAFDVTWQQSVVLALLLAPSCWLGGHLGAVLTHKLPVRWVRVAFVIMMAAAAWRMADLW